MTKRTENTTWAVLLNTANPVDPAQILAEICEIHHSKAEALKARNACAIKDPAHSYGIVQLDLGEDGHQRWVQATKVEKFRVQ